MRERSLAILYALCLWLAACSSGVALARDISVAAVSSRIENGRYVVDARLALQLNDSTREALDNGVTLEFELEAVLLRPRRAWWDAELLHARRRFLLSRHALADGYLLTEAATDRQQTFKRIEDALEALGDIDGYVVGRLEAEPTGRKFRGRLRLRLDIEALPAPLRPIAYVSPSWRMSSGWYEWIFVK